METENIVKNNERSSKLAASWFTFAQMTKRNMKLYFKDKMTVFFSFLSPLIVLLLYVFFLGDLQIDGVTAALDANGVAYNIKDVEAFVESWLISGVVAISCITVALSSLGVIVDDKYKKVLNDFIVSPVKSYTVMFSYYVAAFLTTLILTLGVFAVSLIYLAASGSFFLSAVDILTLIGVIVLSCLSSTLVVMALMSFVKTPAALGVLSTIVGTGIGFLTGAYMPLYMYPDGVQYVASILPGTHSASLFRNLFMTGSLEKITENAPHLYKGLEKMFSFNLNFFGFKAEPYFMYLYLAGSIVVFALVNLLIYKLKRRGL
jgi:multidrug/hemolysin transport system permease protein